MKLPKCTKGKTHKWRWLGNMSKGKFSKNIARVTTVGCYKCECGANKEGRPQ